MSTTADTRAAAAAEILAVDFPNRTISVIAVPYESPPPVVYQNAVWEESFSSTAFSGLNLATRAIRVNRDHDRGRTVGR